MKKYILIFYITGSIIATLPLIISVFFPFGGQYLEKIKTILSFKYDLNSIVLMITAIITLLLIDSYLFSNIKYLKRNSRLLNSALGEKDTKFNIFLSLFTGYFEEILFRGYFFIFSIYLFNAFFHFSNEIMSVFAAVALVSVVFGMFHVVQGMIGALVSFVFSIIFFLTMLKSGCLWYAIAGHALFNFIELTFVFPSNKKKLEKFEENNKNRNDDPEKKN
jgi:membrane protease YdiL (CAAX protease family)